MITKNENFKNKFIKKIGHMVIDNIIDNNGIIDVKEIKNTVINSIIDEIPDNINISNLKNKVRTLTDTTKNKIEIVDCNNKHWDN